MNDKPDRLRLLKSKYLSQISDKEAELKALREKVRLIDELELDAKDLSPTNNGTLKYAGGKFTIVDAAYDALKVLLSAPAPKVAKYLKENGIQPNGSNFNITVGSALKRLEKREAITSERKDGSRIFKIK